MKKLILIVVIGLTIVGSGWAEPKKKEYTFPCTQCLQITNRVAVSDICNYSRMGTNEVIQTHILTFVCGVNGCTNQFRLEVEKHVALPPKVIERE